MGLQLSWRVVIIKRWVGTLSQFLSFRGGQVVINSNQGDFFEKTEFDPSLSPSPPTIRKGRVNIVCEKLT